VNKKSILGSILLLAFIIQGKSAIAVEPIPTVTDANSLTPKPDLIAAKRRKRRAKIKTPAPIPPSQPEITAPTPTNPPTPPTPPNPPAQSEVPSPLTPTPNPTLTPPPISLPSSGMTPAPSNKINWGANLESYYFNWSDNFGNSGNQIVIPFTVTANAGNLDVGVRNAFINSNFNGVLLLDGQKVGTRKGSVSTLSDTSLSLAYTIKEPQFPVRLNLDFNLPTGKATLFGDQKNAIMDGSLVQQTRFGEGFNIAPGVSVAHAFSPNDVVGIGASYILKGQFDPNGDVVKDEIKPGNEVVGTLQYQHLDKNWLVSGGLIYTNYGTTQRGGFDYYRTGDRLDANATFLWAINDRNRLQVNSRYFTQSPNTVNNFLTNNLEKETKNSNGNAIYLGLDYGLALDPEQRHTVHLLADILSVQANSYDRINDLYNAGRNKYSVGVGYDYALSQNTRASVQAKYFQSTDKATVLTNQDIRSNGLNLYATVNFNF
jgi:hypothetical protein